MEARIDYRQTLVEAQDMDVTVSNTSNGTVQKLPYQIQTILRFAVSNTSDLSFNKLLYQIQATCGDEGDDDREDVNKKKLCLFVCHVTDCDDGRVATSNLNFKLKVQAIMILVFESSSVFDTMSVFIFSI